MSKTTLKHVFFGLILLLLFHFETLSIGGVKISHLWKGVALLFISLYLIKNNKIYLFIYGPYILIAIIQLVHIDLSNGFSTPIFKFIITLFFPLVGIFILKYNTNQLKYSLLYFSYFFIASFIPYKLGIINSIKDGYLLKGFGSESLGLIGPYQTAHSASLTLASALVVIVFFWFEGSFKKRFLFPMLFIGVYFLLITYVRTGLVMFILGILPILYNYFKKNTKSKIRLIFMGTGLASFMLIQIFNSDVLMNRILGDRINSSEDTFETMGSGRGLIWLSSGLVYLNSSNTEKIIGMGELEQQKRIGKLTGMNIASHNGFLDLLLVNGIIGLILFLIFLYRVLKFLLAHKSVYNILGQSLFILYLTMCFFQGYSWINTALILMLSLGLCRNSMLQEKSPKKLM